MSDEDIEKYSTHEIENQPSSKDVRNLEVITNVNQLGKLLVVH